MMRSVMYRGNPRLWLQKGWMLYNQKNYGGAISEIGVAIGSMQEEGKKDTKEYAELYDYRGTGVPRYE